jgi:biotin carboxylase
MAALYPDHELILVTKIPGVYLLDMNGSDIAVKSDKIQYVLLDDHDSVEEVAKLIYDLAPAMAVAVSTPAFPLDWSAIKDALIAEELEKLNIPTISHNVYTSVAFFDKWRSHLVLRELGFGVAKAIYIHKDQFWVEKTNPAIATNVYKEYILHRVKDMAYPVIIKDTVGAGSMGIQIADSYQQAEALLTAESNNVDLIVEELVQGEQFGTEIHGVRGKYHVLPPFAFSINEAGITDPFQSVKFGPVTNEKYHIPQLQESLRRMAETFRFAGTAQVDLAFREGKWYVIEINPRWSGMTTTAAAAEGRSPFSIFIESAVGSPADYSKWENLKYVLNFKMGAIDDAELERLGAYPNVRYVMKTVSTSPGREIQYCEVVFGGYDTKEELLAGLVGLREAFPEVVPPSVVQNVEKLSQKV